ncbi:MAG: hypothetical protein E6I08_14720 [Chloroflexi bacterium]|nr:MAG: hypothetical protein E6I08_14720 [Chloroflexota bacterium]
MSGLVQRWGRTGFALAASVIWLLPMAAWAGSVDLYPGPRPWIAFGIGVVLLLVWAGLLVWARRVPVPERPHRFDLAAMSSAERRWWLAFMACGLVVVGWLNGAATVDWSLLHWSGAAAAFVAALLLVLAAALAGAVYSWRRASAAAKRRVNPPLS